MEWIPSHRQESEAKSAQELRANLALWGGGLARQDVHMVAVPGLRSHLPEDIAVCGGPTPTPARKWILQRGCVATFDSAHWASSLPMWGEQRLLWVKWLWGQVHWDGTGAPWSAPPPNAHSAPSTTVPLFTNASYTA